MELKAELKEFEDKMKKAKDFLTGQFDAVRAGRANAAVLNGITVDYYGTPTPINQVAAISVPDPRSRVISPGDAAVR
ncbi:MAG: ribosome recycling factor, partial [Oscillospiraceae bacterium]|nr:ribosome recycling factor [Oscillospiraceae bacterium]